MHRICLLLLLCSLGALAASNASLVTPPTDDGVVIRKDQYQFLSTDKETGWNQIAKIQQSTQWQSPKIDTLNEESSDTLWIRIPLESVDTAGDWRLEVRWPHIPQISMAVWQRESGLGKIYRAGLDVPLSELTFSEKNILFPVALDGTEPAILYLRIEDPGFAFLPMMLWSIDAYNSYDTQRLILFSMAFGVLGVMVLYNLALYLAVRDPMYLFYTNAVFSSALYLLATSGFGRLLFWSENDWLDIRAGVVFASYCFLSVAYFFRVFLDLPRYGGWLVKQNTFFLISYSLVLVGTLTPYARYAMGILGPLSAAGGLASLVVLFAVWRRGNPSAIYFIVAWSGVMISTGFVVSTLSGNMDYFPALEYAQTAGFLFEIVMLSLALADRIRRQRLEKEEAQALALEQQASILQMKEEANTKLEAQVKLRTGELQTAMVDLQNANRELSNLTKVDPLTKVSNRRHFDEVGEQEIARSQRTGEPLSIVMVDIDHFKAINDTYGHVLGDKCLKLITKCITQHIGRASDIVARYGGEEFALILPETGEKDALVVAERIRKAIEEVALIYDGASIRMTASFGICGRVPREGETLNSIVGNADKALYNAKESGRNKVVGCGLSLISQAGIRD